MLYEMSSKERILNTLYGKETDRTPWCPFLAYYWEALPESVRAKGMYQYYLDMGADPLLRGFYPLFKLKRNHCDILESNSGSKRFVTYHTPVGSVTEEYTYSSSANSWFLTGHPIKEKEDFQILQYLTEHTQVLPDYDSFSEESHKMGDGGLILPTLGLDHKTSFQSLVEHWSGTVDLTYALYDFPETVEECLAVMAEKDLETVRISLDSETDGFIFWEDSSTTNISPDFFRRYTAPIITQWGNLLHQNNKLLIHHACGLIKDIIPFMADTPIDAIESITPPPTGNISLAQASEMLPAHIALIGGIDPTMLAYKQTEEILDYVTELLQDMKNRRFILGNSDSCPPNVPYEVFTSISSLIRGMNV